MSGVVDFFARHFGPIVRADAVLNEERREALRRDLIEVFTRFDRSSNGHTRIEGEFLSVAVVR